MSITYGSQKKKTELKSVSGNTQPRYETYGNIGSSAPLITTPRVSYGSVQLTPTSSSAVTYGDMSGGYKVNTEQEQVTSNVGYGFSGGALTEKVQPGPAIVPTSGTISNGNNNSLETQPPATEESQIPTIPMTYKEFIEQEKDRAIQNAETERMRAVIDANAAYEQNKATYGANAETLRHQGMTGSGYSDYIDAQAYAASRGEIQEANKRASQSKETANKTYSENVITRLDKQNEAYQKMLTDENTSIFSINAAASAGTITQEQSEKLIGHIQNNNYLAFSYEISSGDTFDPDAVRIALEAGELTQEQVDKLKGEYMASIQKIDASKYFSGKTQDIARAELETIETDPWITDEVKDKFNYEYNAIFNPSANVTAEANKVEQNQTSSSSTSASDYDIDIFDAAFTSSSFGQYQDTGKDGSKQEKYLGKIIEDAKLGKIPVGAIITANYGSKLSENFGVYTYLGNGKFKKVWSAKTLKDARLSDFENDKIYVPEGYKLKSGGWQDYWGTERIVEE